MTGTFAAAAAAAVLTLATSLPALAGFRIQEADREFPQDTTTYWFQGGKARVDGALEGLTVIVDVKNGEGWLIDEASRLYAGGKLTDLAKITARIERSMISEASPDDAAGGKDAPAEARPLTVAIKDLGAGERLLGRATRRYQVLVDGEVLEELWLAPDIQISREIDLFAFGAGMKQMLGGGAGLSQGYEESEAYRTLRAGGYPLRQVLYFVGEKSTLEVTSVTAKEFPASDFAIPKDFSKIGYYELLLGESD